MASIIIKNAAKGQGKAMTALYEANKQTIYAICKCLLTDEKQAAAATAAAFRDIWHGLKAAKLSTPAQFSAYAAMKAAEQCKKLTLQKNPKALRVPHGKNFLLPDNVLVKDTADSELTYLLANLPPVQRYVLVLRTLGGLSSLQIAGLLNMDIAAIDASATLEADNFQKLQSLSSKGFSSSKDEIEENLAGFAAPVPEAAEMPCRETIASIAAAAEGTLKKQQNTRIIVIFIAAVLVVLITVFGIIAAGSGDAEQDSTGETTGLTSSDGTDVDLDDLTDTVPENSAPALDTSLTYYADIEIADYGKITVQLDQASAPATAANFVNLAQEGFYNGLTFHRIMEGFMMQGGCPNGNGGGGADENVVGEFAANGHNNELSHTRGAISMARSDPYNSASSQFFIVHEDSTFLDGNYACFGYVTEGLDVVDAVCETAEPTDNNGTIPASAQPVISSITIRTEPAE